VVEHTASHSICSVAFVVNGDLNTHINWTGTVPDALKDLWPANLPFTAPSLDQQRKLFPLLQSAARRIVQDHYEKAMSEFRTAVTAYKTRSTNHRAITASSESTSTAVEMLTLTSWYCVPTRKNHLVRVVHILAIRRS